MTNQERKSQPAGTSGSGCDVKVWAASCLRSEYSSEGDKYLCATCGTIVGLDHEVHHEIFPHISGDEDNLS